MSKQEQAAQVEDLLRTLTSLASELELLVERNKSGDRVETSSGDVKNINSSIDFTKHKSLNSPVRLNIGGKVFTATWKMLSQHNNTKELFEYHNIIKYSLLIF